MILVLLLSCSLFVLGLIILTLGVTLIRLHLSMVIEQCEMMLSGCLDSDGGPHRCIYCVGISEFLESLRSRLPWMQLNLHSLHMGLVMEGGVMHWSTLSFLI